MNLLDELDERMETVGEIANHLARISHDRINKNG